MSLVLYDYKAAPSPRRARIFLAEKGIEYEDVQVDLRAGAQLEPEFQAINPRCTVPVLALEDGTRLCDNSAIAAWAEAIRPDPPLLGVTPVEKAMVASWNTRAESEGFMAVAEILRNTSPAMKDRGLPGPRSYAQIPALAERGAARLPLFFDALDQALAGREFLATDGFSLADITAFVVVDFASWVKVRPAEGHKDLRRWFDSLSARPSIGA